MKCKDVVKKIMTIGMTAALTFSVAACGGASGQEDASGQKGNAAGSAEQEGASGTEGKAEDTGETYEIVVSLTQSSGQWAVELMKEECAKIEESTNGRLKFTIYDSGTLLKVPDTFKGVQDGIADIAFMPNNIAYDYFGINGKLLSMPMMGFESEQQAYDIYNQLRQEFPEIDGETEEYGIVNLGEYFNAPSHLYMKKDKEILSLDDLKGMKIGSSDSKQTDLINGIGATGVYITSADAYTSLDNGVVDAAMHHILFFQVTACDDIINKIVRFGNSGVTRGFAMLIMNKDKYDSLPEDLQKAVKDGFAEIAKKSQQFEIENIESYMQHLEDNGAQVSTLSEEVVAPLKEQAKEIHVSVIKELEDKGVNAQKIYDRVQELISAGE